MDLRHWRSTIGYCELVWKFGFIEELINTPLLPYQVLKQNIV